MGVAVADQVVPMRFGGVDVLVQTVKVPGTEPTSRAGDAAAKVLDAFDRARDVIVGTAASTVEVLAALTSQASRPDKLEVEFGLGFSAKGNVIVASGSVDATLKVKLTYESKNAE